LGEIDAQLRKYALITDVATLLHGTTAEDKRLVSYVVLAPGQTALDSSDLRKFLTEHLPAYMIPAIFIAVDKIPLTANGKADRTALPDPDTYISVTGAIKTRPETPSQNAIASIWERLLSKDSLGIDDNFFDLGGHSLLTIKLIQELEKATGHRLTIADIFENPTIRELATLLPETAWQDIEAPAESANVSRWSRLWKYITGGNR
jgi:acyl carrier protein